MQLITAHEAAKRLDISLRTLWRWRDAGKIAEAERHGITVMFDAAEVDALGGRDTAPEVTIGEAYRALVDSESEKDVGELRDRMAATICTRAKDKAPLEAAYRAACGMAAAGPEDTREKWGETARKYGAWLGIEQAKTRRTISGMRAKLTQAQALARLEAAPEDPAYVMAAGV